MQTNLTTPTFGDPRLPARFWEKVNPNGPIPAHRSDLGPCWEWTGAKLRDGYGPVNKGSWANSKATLVHRITYEAVIGPIPQGQELDHLSRNHSCVRLSHVEPVTHRENMRRGNIAKGARAGRAKLTEGDVLAIRSLRG